ncbi:MAG: right-handed parallel beta-helix repeat-containing protein [Planctomycetota bacterium]
MKRLLIICIAAVFMTALGNTAQAVNWHVPGDFATIQDAIDSGDVMDGDTIIVGSGNHDGATVTKAVEIKGEDGAVINSGPAYSRFMTGFYFRDGAGNGATISNLSFETVDLPVYSRDTDDVTIDHCTMSSPVQGITNWNGNGWNISHNVINGLRTDSGGGIGIFVGTRDYEGATANNNLIAHNKVTGQVVVPQDEIDRYNELEPYPEAGYTVAGIDLYSDRRSGPAGPITGNSILKNKVAISSNNPRNHPADGIGLTDFGLNQEPPVADIVNNKVGFNDVRGVTGTSSTPISLWPDPVAVADNNVISRNLGDDANNRGGGAHPQALFD